MSGIWRMLNSPSVISAMSKLVPPMSVHTMLRAERAPDPLVDDASSAR